jgi:hypothetical protein
MTRPSKRRKKDIPPQLGPKIRKKGPELQIQLTKSRAESLGLERTIFMESEKLEYITFNSNNADYLYYISGCLFDVCSTKITLYYSVNGADDSDDWEPVEAEDIIKSGNYLVVFEDDAGHIPPLP